MLSKKVALTLLFCVASVQAAACSIQKMEDLPGPTPAPSATPDLPVAPDAAGEVDASPSAANADAGSPDADSGPEPADGEPPPNGYWAWKPPQPQLVSAGGHILTSPKLVAITFNGDAYRADLEAFISKIGPSHYWHATTAEYGILAAVALPPVHVAEPPRSTLSDGDVQSWLADKLDGTHPEFPAPDENTLYTIFYPTGVSVALDPQTLSCSYFLGYHSETQLPSGKKVSYAVVPRCTSGGGLTGVNLITEVTSHELFEAATDPLPFTSPAFNGLDPDHYAWGFVFLSEGGDLCVQADELTVKPDDIGFSAQRMWSNAYAKLGHDPCVPAVKNTTFFNSAPVLPDTLTFVDRGQRVTTKGLQIPVGGSKTIEVQLFSDGPTGVWTVTAIDPASLRGGDPSPLSFAFDKSTGKNGDVLRLTITRRAGGAGFDAFMLQSKLGTERHFWPGLVGD